jgi:hypothetical protein
VAEDDDDDDDDNHHSALPFALPCLAAAARLAAICLLACLLQWVPNQRDQAVYTTTARVAYNAWLAFHPKQQ